MAGDLAVSQRARDAKERAALLPDSALLLAYADPPYLGCCKLYGHRHEAPYGCWDDPETHQALINDLDYGYDGWALSLSSPSLQTILSLCPTDVRVAAWVKPFASFKPNVNPAYAWEPVIFAGGRRGDRDRLTVRDWCSEVITLKKGLTGAKPPKVCKWILDLLGYEPALSDQFEDVFPGTGIMGSVLAQGRVI